MANELNDIDILRQYGRGSFRGVEFPVASMKTGITQDQAEHKYPGKNTALSGGIRVTNLAEIAGRDPNSQPIAVNPLCPITNSMIWTS
jgi:hypothetical protein